MVLDADVTDANGLLLLAAGMKLTGQHVGVLKMREVSVVTVRGSAQAPPLTQSFSKIKTEQLDKTQRDLDLLFKHTDRAHPAMAELHRLCLKRRAEKLVR